MVGQMISHYKILSELGRGGMGVFYKTQNTKLERPVARNLPSASTKNEMKSSASATATNVMRGWRRHRR